MRMVDLIWIAPDDLFQTTEAVTALRSQITRNLGNGNLYVAEKMVDLVGIRDDLFHETEGFCGVLTPNDTKLKCRASASS